MKKWYDIIGNSIQMRLYNDSEEDYIWVSGKVVNGYRYMDGIVTMQSEDGRLIWTGVNFENIEFKKTEASLGDILTRAEHIRAMTDEQLADSIIENEDIFYDIDFCQNRPDCTDLLDEGGTVQKSMCKECLIKWLQSDYVDKGDKNV